MPEVEKLNLADAMDFYRAHYTPGNATLIIAGDVDPETAKTLAEKYYGPLANTASTAPRRRAAEPNAMEARRLSETSPQAQFSYVTRSSITPSRAQAGPKDSAALDFLAAVLGTGSQSRLYKKLVLEEKLATDVGAGFIGNQLDSGKLTFYCIPAPGVGIDKLENALDTILDDVAKNGVTQTELDRVRNQAIDAQIYALDDPMTLLQHVGTSVMTGLTPSEAFSTSAWNDVAISDVQRELKLIATPANATTGILTKG